MPISAYRTRIHQILFLLAALYHLGFGLWAGFLPHSFFSLFALAPPRHPVIWQCLGMVIGLYGFAYGYAALRLDRARPFIAIGLIGKILGPIAWVIMVVNGEWPIRTFTLILFNDLLWWLPFSLFLLEGTRLGDRARACAPYACAALNAMAAGAMLVLLRPGMEVVADPAGRVAYISQNPVLWRGGWALWIAAALSLLAFYGWWGSRLSSPGWARGAFLIAVAGIVCDGFAESLYIGWLPDHLDTVAPLGTLLTGAAANGLYTLAGVILTLATRSLKGAFLVWTWIIWMSGLSLTVSTLVGSVAGMVGSTAVLMTIFSPWVLVMGGKLKRALPAP
jgi:hypothetical protein